MGSLILAVILIHFLFLLAAFTMAGKGFKFGEMANILDLVKLVSAYN